LDDKRNGQIFEEGRLKLKKATFFLNSNSAMCVPTFQFSSKKAYLYINTLQIDMKALFCLIVPVLICSLAFSQQMNTTKLTYPSTRKVDTVDTYFGTHVPDPYRWLEDDRGADTKAWVEAENKVTQDYLSQIPYREAIHKRLQQLWNYEKYSAPFKEGQYTYFYKNDGLQSQAVLWRQIGDGAPEVFLDPNKFSADGTTSMQGIDFTRDGSLAAYQLSEGGSDWRKVVVINTADKSMVGDTLTNIKFIL
jgi:prolyl oligopeptidase